MSDEHPEDAATIAALLDRLLKFRLPRTLEIRDRVDGGARLTDTELDFLKRAVEEAAYARKFVERNPEFHHVAAQLTQLFAHIVSKALENESSPAVGPDDGSRPG